MKRKLVVALSTLLIAGAATTSFAFNGVNQDTTRLRAMGLENYQTADFGNQWRNPAYVMTWKNRARGFLGGYTASTTSPNQDRTTGWGGLNLDSSYGTFGLWYGRPTTNDVTIAEMGTGYTQSIAGTTSVTGESLNTVVATVPTNNLDILYGRDLGAVLFGVRLNYNAVGSDGTGKESAEADPLDASSNLDRETLNEDSLNTSARDLGLQFGAILKNMPVRASLVIGLPSLNSEAKLRDKLEELDAITNTTVDSTTVDNISETLESDGAMNLGIYVNGDFKLSETSTLIPTVRLETTKNDSKMKSTTSSILTLADDSSADATADTITETYAGKGERGSSSILFGIDGALNIKPNDKTLVVAAVGFEYKSTDSSVKESISDSKSVASLAPNTPTYMAIYGVQNDTEQDGSTLRIPFVIGVEDKSLKDGKVALRMGIKGDLYYNKESTSKSKTFYNNTDKPSVNVTDRTSTSESVLSGTGAATVNMGIGYQFSNSVMLAGVLNQDILFSGTYLISGVPETLFTGVLIEKTF